MCLLPLKPSCVPAHFVALRTIEGGDVRLLQILLILVVLVPPEAGHHGDHADVALAGVRGQAGGLDVGGVGQRAGQRQDGQVRALS